MTMALYIQILKICKNLTLAFTIFLLIVKSSIKNTLLVLD